MWNITRKGHFRPDGNYLLIVNYHPWYLRSNNYIIINVPNVIMLLTLSVKNSLIIHEPDSLSIWPLADVILGSPKFNFSASFVNSQLFCLPPVGILNQVMFIDHCLFILVLKSPDGEWPITYKKHTDKTSLAWALYPNKTLLVSILYIKNTDKHNLFFLYANIFYCLYYPSNLFCNARNFQNCGIFNNYSMSARWLWDVIVHH